MTRDYKYTPRHVEKPLPGWVWWLTGLTMGLTVALLVYLNQPRLAPSEPRPATNVSADSPPGAASAEERKTAPSPDRQFDFYTLLPELEVIVPENQARTAAETRAREPAPTQTTAQGPYILQAGSFQHLQEADSLKATMALVGVEANIQTVTVDRSIWHRVRVGPYAHLTELHRVRDRLARNQIDTVVLQQR